MNSRTEIVDKIIELAEVAASPRSPFEYLLGIALGGLEHVDGMDKAEILPLCEGTLNLTLEECREISKRVDAERGSS